MHQIEKITFAHLEQRFSAIHSSIHHLEPWFPWAHAQYSKAECRRWIELSLTNWDNDKDYNFAIIDDESSEYVGEVKIMDVKRDYAERNAALAVWVRSDWLRKHAGHDALTQAAKYAFSKLKLLRLKLMIDPNNISSQKLAEAASAKYEGTLRNQWCFDNSRILDVKLYSLIPEDIGLNRQDILLGD